MYAIPCSSVPSEVLSGASSSDFWNFFCQTLPGAMMVGRSALSSSSSSNCMQKQIIMRKRTQNVAPLVCALSCASVNVSANIHNAIGSVLRGEYVFRSEYAYSEE